MNATSRLFRLCRQRQLQPIFAANTRQIARTSSIFQKRAFISSSRRFAQLIDGTGQSVSQTTQPSTDDKPKSLFCGNLAFGIEKETVLQAFEKYGTPTGVRLSRGNKNRWGGYNGGFCFVEFASHEEAGAALKAMNGAEIGGLAINLKYEIPSHRDNAKGEYVRNTLLKNSYESKKTLSEQDQEYARTQPLVTGTVSRTGTMLKTVAVTTNHRRLDKYTQTHHVQGETELVHDPEGILVEGDVIKYQHFPPDIYAQRAALGKTRVKFILKEVITPFGIPVEERTPHVAVEQALAKNTKRRRSKDKVAATVAL